MNEQAKQPRRRTRRAQWLVPVYVVFLLLFIGANLGDSVSYAWLFGVNITDNTFLTPDLDIFVDESDDGVNYGAWTPQDIDWGGTVDKYARFTNTGEASVVVRAAYARQWAITTSTETIYLNNLYANGFVFDPVAQLNWVDNGFLNTSLWYDGGDGWYYYRLPLAPGDSTVTVLESVSFAYPIPAEYLDADYALLFKVEACQYSTADINENAQAAWLSFGRTYSESGGMLTWTDIAP